MTLTARYRWGRVLLAALAASAAWAAMAGEDDALDHGVSFHIAPSPLGPALIDFSTQSGVQVAAADAEISGRQSGGVVGTYPIRTALEKVLQGTGLEFSRVGVQTVAIRAAAGGPLLGTLLQAGDAVPPDVAVSIPRAPTDQEVAGDAVYRFVVHHATVHYFNSGVRGNLAVWHGGMAETICPAAFGLDSRFNEFVSARFRAVATSVGAPLQADPKCDGNVRIFFTNEPDKVMERVASWASVYFRGRYGALKRLIEYRGDRAIQGWYFTTNGGVPNASITLQPIGLLPVWPQISPRGESAAIRGIGTVMLVVDTTKVAGYTIGAIADYVTMLSLSIVQSPDYCDPLPSILDLLSSGCSARDPPMAMTAGDFAFLKALYSRNSWSRPSLSRDEIQDNMLRQFNRR